jgi:hypothetical protein
LNPFGTEIHVFWKCRKMTLPAFEIHFSLAVVGRKRALSPYDYRSRESERAERRSAGLEQRRRAFYPRRAFFDQTSGNRFSLAVFSFFCGALMGDQAELFLREQSGRYLEWAECARRDALRAIGRNARASYLAVAEQWENRAVELKRRLWREGPAAPSPARERAPGAVPPPAKMTTDSPAVPLRYVRDAKRPRRPPVAVMSPFSRMPVPVELHY